jgi:phage terminase Nu1 subunit (DNA packaging protein)
MAREPLSLRAYARHRKELGLTGGHLQAVQRAVESERITYVLVNGLKRIPDPDAADREWAENTDHSRAPGYVRELADEEDSDAEGAEGPRRGALSKASAEEKLWKAKHARLKYEREIGKVVDADEMAAAMADTFSTVRTKLLGLPSRLRQRRPQLTLDDLATLEELVREDLEGLASDEDDEDPSE